MKFDKNTELHDKNGNKINLTHVDVVLEEKL